MVALSLLLGFYAIYFSFRVLMKGASDEVGYDAEDEYLELDPHERKLAE